MLGGFEIVFVALLSGNSENFHRDVHYKFKSGHMVKNVLILVLGNTKNLMLNNRNDKKMPCMEKNSRLILKA